MPQKPNHLMHPVDANYKGLHVSLLTTSSPYLGIAILVIFVIAGKVFRDNFKLKGEHWKRNCWMAGAVASACFGILAFAPFVQGN